MAGFTARTTGTPDASRALAAGLLVLLGLGLVAHPLYLWPHYGQQGYTVVVEEVAEPPGTATDYEQLPPAAQDAFDRAVAGENPALWSGDDDGIIDRFWDRPVVRHDGAYYRVTLLHGDSAAFIEPVLRWYLTAIGTFLAVLGGLMGYAASWRPFTPVRALWLPAATTVAIYGTNAYDVLYSGVQRAPFSIASEVVLLIPVTTLALAVGSAAATDRDRRLVAGGLVAMVLPGVAIAGSPHPVSLLVVTAYLAVGGAPWFALGYRLAPRG